MSDGYDRYDDDRQDDDLLASTSQENYNDEPQDSTGGYAQEPLPNENYGFEEDGGEYAANPADSDGLGDEEFASNPAGADGLDDDFHQERYTYSETGKSEEEEIEATEKAHAEKTRNKAPFLNRFRILMVIFASLLVIIILSVFVIPSFKKEDNEEDLLDKRGQVYIPDKITRWSPDEALVQSSPFEINVPAEKPMTDAEVDNLLAGIPYSDEAQKQQQNTAPVPVQPSPGGSTGTIATRPVTNRNEQQKAVNRMPLNDGGFAGAVGNAIAGYGSNYPGYSQTPSGYGNNGLPYTAESYGQYAQDRMASLLAQTQSMASGYGGGNSYQQQNMQSQKQQFQSAGAGNYSMQWNNDYSLHYGTIIPAALITGINTDLPGLVIAQVTSNVYSSLDGKHLLIPAGTRIFATYNSSVSYGQNRVQVAWDKMIRPDGLEIDLGNFTGVDNKGFAGYRGWVSNHPFETLKALGLIAAFSLLDTKMENIQGAQNNLYTQNVLADTYAEVNKLGAKIIDRALDIQPTITIPQGTEVKIITNVTMSLPPVDFNPQVEKYVRK